MAKKKHSKSEAIRSLLKQNPRMKAKEVKEALAANGLKVTSNLIYFIKGKMGRRKRRRAVRGVSAASSLGDTVDMVRRVKDMAQELGGMGKLKELVDTLAE